MKILKLYIPTHYEKRSPKENDSVTKSTVKEEEVFINYLHNLLNLILIVPFFGYQINQKR